VPPTLRDVLRIQDLGLVVRAGDEELDRPISCAHTSELDDPTPFLAGGEVLLTTGQFGETTDQDLTAYVKRLAAAGVAGLGFGLGPPHPHPRTPPALVAAADEVGLPLLEVPPGTPFIAISQAVFRATAAEACAAVRRIHESQHALTRAAVGRDAASAVGRLLAHELKAWTLVLDATDALVVAEPASAARWVSGLGHVLDRLRTSRPPASGVFRFGDAEVLLQSLGSGPRVRGFLAAGRAASYTESERQLLNTAAWLLSVGLEQSHALDAVERQLRAGVLELLQAGAVSAARPVARELHRELPGEPIRLVALAGRPEARAAGTELLKSEATRMREGVFYAEADDVTVVAVTDARPLGSWLLTLPSRIDGLSIGVSEPADYEHFSDARRQAAQAAEAGMQGGTRVTSFAELRKGGLVLFMDFERAQTFAAAVVEPLVRHDQIGRGDLVNSLRVWLKNNGQWDPAAAQLGVHRHTLRQRIHKVERLLDRPIDSPNTRAELWLALQVLDNSPS
jgi:PucR family transcriptional regulator, purine catabolism regulatory protein